MPSSSLIKWRGQRNDALDEIAAAHAIVGGTARGRRYATQQLNYSYTTLLSSHFQGFCRDLHSECVDHIVAATPVQLRPFLRVEFLRYRTLDKGNPHPGGIGTDFDRLGLSFWSSVDRIDTRNPRRRRSLQEMIDWRNAIGHQDFGPLGGNSSLHLKQVRDWRSIVNALAVDFDRTMYNYLVVLIGTAPW